MTCWHCHSEQCEADQRAREESIIRATRDELATMRAHDEPTIYATDFDQMVARIIATAEQETP